MADLDDIEFVTDGRVYLPPASATGAPFIVLFGSLTRAVERRGRSTVPFVAVISRPDGSVVEVDHAELDFPMPTEPGEAHTVILRGVGEAVAPRGSIVRARRRS